MSRFEAVDAAQVERSSVKGSTTAAEKACFISHRNVVRQHLSSGAPIMVLEDDAVFGQSTCQTLDRNLGNLSESGWDIIFTDICVPDVGTWPDLLRLRRSFDETKALKLLSLARFHFAGATAYILNGRSKRLLAQEMDRIEQIDQPYDLYLRSLVHQGRLRAYVTFPFVTSISEVVEQSSIQTDASLDQILNWFRRLVWLERDLDKAGPSIRRLQESFSTPETALFAALFEGLISGNIQRR